MKPIVLSAAFLALLAACSSYEPPKPAPLPVLDHDEPRLQATASTPPRAMAR